MTLMLTFGSVYGAHFNPALTLADTSQGGIRGREVPGYIAAQAVGALLSVWAAHLMCDEAVIQVSQHVRAVGAQMFSEFAATLGLLSVIWGLRPSPRDSRALRGRPLHNRAHWFTASTSSENPAVTLARSFTNTFAASVRPTLRVYGGLAHRRFCRDVPIPVARAVAPQAGPGRRRSAWAGEGSRPWPIRRRF